MRPDAEEARLDRRLQRLYEEAFRPWGIASAERQVALRVALGAAGVTLGLAGRALPPLGFVLVLIGGACLIALSRLGDRWQWPWQRLIIWQAAVGRRDQISALGAPMPRDLEAWLDATPPDAVPARWRASALLAVGRVDEARTVVAALPLGTSGERLAAARLTCAIEALDGAGLDRAMDLHALAELDDADRGALEAYRALVRGAFTLERVALRRQARPVARPPGLGVREWAVLWHVRTWPVLWFAMPALATWSVFMTISMLR